MPHLSTSEDTATDSSLEHQAQTLTLPVLGMTCAACRQHVESALAEAPGVLQAHVDLMRHCASVEFDTAVTNPATLVTVIRDSGYDSAVPRNTAAAPANSAKPAAGAGSKAALTILAGVAAMIFSMPIGMDAGSAGGPGGLDAALMVTAPWLYEIPESPLRWTLLIVTGVLAVWAGRDIYRSAWKALLHRETNMNTLVSLGTGVAFFYSAYGTVFPGEAATAVYFDSVLLILGFLLLGKWLEGRARHSALAAVDALAELQPATARTRRNGDEQTIPVEELILGDQIIVLPGERIPADAVILTGRTTVDESMLTGESVPIGRGVGERILAGSVNYDGAVTARVESAGEGTTLRQIARLVEQAQGSRAPMERLADRASAIFVPVVLGLAAATLIGWLLITGSVADAVAATVSVLVIACPCAMGLAVPAALTVAIGRGAQFGVLIKGGEALERVAGLQAVVMDKTGTLTLGKPSLVSMAALGDFTESDALRIAAAAEDHSAHPLAHAVVSYAREKGLSWPPAAEVQVIPGRGLSAQVEGKAILLGNTELMQEWAIPFPADTQLDTPLAQPGITRLWMAVDSNPAAYFDARDVLRPSAKTAVNWLQQHGLTVAMLTGDSPQAAAPIAEAVGITQVSAGLMPADKLEQIRSLQASGKSVAMVGDGINDAAALAQADAGMAMGAGAALAQEAGDVLLLTSDPAGVVTAISLARATIRVMHQNLFWAAGYNVIGIPLAAGLLYPWLHLQLTPWMAAAAMAFSSVSVLLNSLRLRAWKTPLKPAN